MEVFKDVVHTSEKTLDYASKRHLIMPSIANSLESDGIDVVWHEAAMRATGVSDGLAQHTSEEGF